MIYCISMSEVQFEEENLINPTGSALYGRFQSSVQLPKIVNFMIRIGIVKTSQQANIFLLIIIAITALVALYFLVKAFTIGNHAILTDTQLQKIKQSQIEAKLKLQKNEAI
jgi:hypothetical protein